MLVCSLHLYTLREKLNGPLGEEKASQSSYINRLQGSLETKNLEFCFTEPWILNSRSWGYKQLFYCLFSCIDAVNIFDIPEYNLRECLEISSFTTMWTFNYLIWNLYYTPVMKQFFSNCKDTCRYIIKSSERMNWANDANVKRNV